MKKLITLGIAFVAFLAGAAMAGDYHQGATLYCQECHVLHYSESHTLEADNSGFNVAKGADGPYEYLLRNHINELCLTCHNGTGFAPDVLGADFNAAAHPNGRLGGGLNSPATVGTGYTEYTGHTLGFTGAAPGGAWTNSNGLDCIDCHTQHGRTTGSGATTAGVYRNLNVFFNGDASQTPAAGTMSYAVGTNDVTKDVFERAAASYDNNDVDFNEPVSNVSEYAAFCGQCHANFHGDASAANMRNTAGPAGTEWYRHPVADVNIGVAGGGHSSISRAWGLRAYRVKVLSAAGNWGTQGTPLGGTATGDWTPSCMSCHKAHGNQKAYGLIFASGAANPGEDGDGTNYKVLCKQCHAQG